MSAMDEQRDLEARWEEWRKRRTLILKGLVFPAAIGMLGLLFIGAAFQVNIQALIVFCIGVLFLAALLLAVGRPHHAAVRREHLTGTRVQRLDAPMTSEPLVPLGHVRMSEDAARVHTLIEGATGTGKTQLLKQMAAFIRARGDTLVVVDSGYEMHRTFGRPDDIVLSVFDDASPGWLPQNEIRSSADWGALAQSLIGDGKGEAQQWHQMAKAMFAATAKGYSRVVEEAGQPFDHKELFHLLTGADAATLAPFLKGSAAASLGTNDKALNNVRMTFFETLKFWELLRPGPFSVRDWVEQGGNRPSIFIPHTKRQLPESKNLISCWLDQIITTACDRGEDHANRVWVIIDELSSLGEIPSLKSAVTELRKTGFRVVVGIQNFEQVEDLYGRSGAVTVTNSLSNKVIFRATDAASAERQSKAIGDALNRIWQHSVSVSDKGGSQSLGARDQVERVVLASEIMALPDLTAYVRLVGSGTVHLTPVPIYRPGEASQKPVEVLVSASATPEPMPALGLLGTGLRARIEAARASALPLWEQDVAMRRDGMPRVGHNGQDVSAELFGPEPTRSKPPPGWMLTDNPDTLRRLAIKATQDDAARIEAERSARSEWVQDEDGRWHPS